jgi:hypothetical protein
VAGQNIAKMTVCQKVGSEKRIKAVPQNQKGTKELIAHMR